MIKLPESIKWIITDFDGVVTDNCVYIHDDGVMARKLNFKDVIGFSMLRKKRLQYRNNFRRKKSCDRNNCEKISN